MWESNGEGPEEKNKLIYNYYNWCFLWIGPTSLRTSSQGRHSFPWFPTVLVESFLLTGLNDSFSFTRLFHLHPDASQYETCHRFPPIYSSWSHQNRHKINGVNNDYDPWLGIHTIYIYIYIYTCPYFPSIPGISPLPASSLPPLPYALGEDAAERQLALQLGGALLVRGAVGRRALLACVAVGHWDMADGWGWHRLM